MGAYRAGLRPGSVLTCLFNLEDFMKKFFAIALAFSFVSAWAGSAKADAYSESDGVRAGQIPLSTPGSSRRFYDTLRRDGD